MKTPFDGLMSFQEATKKWGLSESTLRQAVFHGRLKEEEEIHNFGKQWVITEAAMRRMANQKRANKPSFTFLFFLLLPY